MREALRYLNNAKEILKSVPVEGGAYIDIKLVREAFSTAHLGVLEAINESLIQISLPYRSRVYMILNHLTPFYTFQNKS